MDDYQYQSEYSPAVWCYKCKQMVKVDGDKLVMKTVFRTTPQGIYPYGLCTKHQCHNFESNITANQAAKP